MPGTLIGLKAWKTNKNLRLIQRALYPSSRASFISFYFIFYYTESICTERKGSACRVHRSLHYVVNNLGISFCLFVTRFLVDSFLTSHVYWLLLWVPFTKQSRTKDWWLLVWAEIMKCEIEHGAKLVTQHCHKSLVISRVNQTIREYSKTGKE